MKVVIDLLSKGYDIYLPAIDDNGVDFLVSNGKQIKKVQCKSHDKTKSALNTSVEINTRKCKIADVIADPLKPRNCICYIDSKDANRAFNIAYIEIPQRRNRNWYKDFLEFPW